MLAAAQGIVLNKPSDGWHLSLQQLNVDTSCLSKLPAGKGSASPLSLSDIQKQLPRGQLHIAQLTISPWQQYAGDLLLINDEQAQNCITPAPR